ncbi:Methionine synthase [subsurface metagenome]|jgi:5-methyltetrahydrofolate--homocysteine methyltransferase
MVDLIKIKDSVIKGEVDEVRDMVKRAIDEGQEAKRILNEALLPGMSIVGDKFEEGDFFLPEMLIAAMAMKEGLEVLSPVLTQSDMKAAGTVVMGTAKGDIHDVGKSIVGVMLEGAGFMVTDIGVDVGPDKFVEAAKENNADIIGVSALLTTTIMGMKDVIKAVKEAGLKAKVMVGGASVTQEFADEIGADGYAPDAPSAVKRAKELV